MIWDRLGELHPSDSHRLQPVKQVVAVVKPYLAEKVLEALKHAPLEACGVREVKGYGRQKGHTEVYRGSEYQIDFLPKIKLEIVVADTLADGAVDAILKAAKTGQVGDGKIFIYDVEDAVRVRTGESGEEAL